MNDRKPAGLLVLCLLLAPGVAACEASAAAPGADPPAVVEEIAGSDVKTVRLSEDAADAAGIKAATVSRAPASGRLQIPYAAVIYYLDGSTWAYQAQEKNTFRRIPIRVESIAGDVATLTAGPPVGSNVVVVGATEVLGSELEISGEQ